MSIRIDDPPQQSAATLVTGILDDLQSLVHEQFCLTVREVEMGFRRRAEAIAVIAVGAGLAIVGAVQETVESVTNAVKGAMQSVTDAIDLRQQLIQHPWLILGGSVSLGYLAVDFLEQTAIASGTPAQSGMPPSPQLASNNIAGTGFQQSPVSFLATHAAINAATEAASTNLLWHQLTTAVTEALVGIVQDAATHVVPQIMEYLDQSNPPTDSAPTKEPANATR